jgi:hypothetical protein
MKELLIRIKALFEGAGTDQAAQGLDKVTKAAEEAKQATSAIDNSANKSADSLNKLGNAAADAGDKSKGLSGGLIDGNAKAGIFAGGVAALGTAVINFATQAVEMALAALKNLIAAFAQGILQAADFAGKMTDLAARTGAPIESLVILQKAFENAGMSAEQVGPMINRLQKSLAGINENGEPTAEVFQRLGLSVQKLQTQTPDEQFNAIAQAIAKLPNPTQQAAAAMELFGRGGGQMLALFKDGTAFATAAAQVGSLGANTAKAASSLDVFSDAMGSLDDKKMGFFMAAAAQFATDLERAGIAINDIDLGPLGEQVGLVLRGAIEVNKSLVQWAGYVKQFTDALGLTGPLLETIKNAIISLFGPLGHVVSYLHSTGQEAVKNEEYQQRVDAALQQQANSAQIARDFIAQARAESSGLSAEAMAAGANAVSAAGVTAEGQITASGQTARDGIGAAANKGSEQIQLSAQEINLAAQQLAQVFQEGMGSSIAPALQALVDAVQANFQNLSTTLTQSTGALTQANSNFLSTVNSGFQSLVQQTASNDQSLASNIRSLSASLSNAVNNLQGQINALANRR